MTEFKSSIYTLHEKIGEGGFGKVYKGTNINTQQTVAVKLLTLSPEFDTDKRRRYIQRFERETYLISKLQHPNIVRLLDKGQVSEYLIYAVFEFVEGQSLKERLFDSKPLKPVEAAEIMSQVLDGLAHAHQKGVVHRDIKPANIMLSTIGAKTHAKILDFGIGTLVDEVRQLDFKSLTLTQETLGTPSYSAPEQLRGEPPTPKTDLYVWGLVFIECLTGTPAITGSSIASIFQKHLDPVNIPLPPAVASHPVSMLLRRVLNKKTSERASCALEIYNEFTRLNFSNLVGDIYHEKRRRVSKTNKEKIFFDKTQIDDKNFLSADLVERKQITVLCVTLSFQFIDSEENEESESEVINILHQDQKSQYVDIAARYGALHVGTLADTSLFYFGYPRASGCDSHLCARAALEFICHLKKKNSLLSYPQGIVSEARIGIHSGLVTVYSDSVPEGDTPNIAMALSRKAQANQILCSNSTRKILGSQIECVPCQTTGVGIDSEEMPLFSLIGERIVEAYGFLGGSHWHRSFIGREAELADLKGLLQNDRTSLSTSRSGYVYGEAGIGKSRLVFELRKQATSYTHFIAQCLPEYRHNALFPILAILKYKYSLDALNEQQAIECIRNLLAEQEKLNEKHAISVLCVWLNLTPPDDIAISHPSPGNLKNLLFQVITYLLNRHDGSELNDKSLFIFEDMHWADPMSIEFIEQYISSRTFQQSQHVFICTSRRPLFNTIAIAQSLLIEVKSLDVVDTKKLISHLFNEELIGKKVVDLIVNKTDGIPLFIEELVNTLKQKHLLEHLNGKIEFVDSDKLIEVPNTLRDLLQQNLDILSGAKEVAQLASAIGREFSYKLLMESSQVEESCLESGLDKLIEAELVYVQRRIDDDSYCFKHGLVRDAVYQSMPKSRQQEAHKLIAQSLESKEENIQQEDASLLAMHWGEAKVYDKAVSWGKVAIKAALKRSSIEEAIVQEHKILYWILNINDENKIELLPEPQKLLTSTLQNVIGPFQPSFPEIFAKQKGYQYTTSTINHCLGMELPQMTERNTQAMLKAGQATVFTQSFTGDWLVISHREYVLQLRDLLKQLFAQLSMLTGYVQEKHTYENYLLKTTR